MFEISSLKSMKLPQLQEIAKLAGIKHYGLKKEELIQLILKIQDDKPVQKSNETGDSNSLLRQKRNRINKNPNDREPELDVIIDSSVVDEKEEVSKPVQNEIASEVVDAPPKNFEKKRFEKKQAPAFKENRNKPQEPNSDGLTKENENTQAPTPVQNRAQNQNGNNFPNGNHH
ncbi:MAG: Rho termination factor N-terminal domain-containing protein, partial [Flavobacterium sp.]